MSGKRSNKSEHDVTAEVQGSRTAPANPVIFSESVQPQVLRVETAVRPGREPETEKGRFNEEGQVGRKVYVSKGRADDGRLTRKKSETGVENLGRVGEETAA